MIDITSGLEDLILNLSIGICITSIGSCDSFSPCFLGNLFGILILVISLPPPICIILSDRKVLFPKLSSLVKIKYPEPEYTFNVELPNGDSKSVKAKHIKQIVLQEEIRSIIAAAADFVPPKVKSNEFQEVLDSLFPPKEELLPPKGTTPDEQLEEYLKEYINGPQAKSNVSFKAGSVLVEGEYAYFKYQNFYNSLKNKDWKRKINLRLQEKIITNRWW